MQYADILVDHKLSNKQTLTYTILPEQLPYLAIGSIVLVPFGRSKIHGVIVRLHKGINAALKQKLKPITSVLYTGTFVPPYLINAVFKLEREYGYNASELLFRLLPALRRRPQSMLPNNTLTESSTAPVYSYQLSSRQRIVFYQALWNKLVPKGHSLLILASTKESVIALTREFDQHAIPYIVYPEVSAAKQYQYFLSSLQTDKPKIYMGTRGALITSLNQIGAVIIDEPWLPGHKDDRSPRYWTPLVALGLSRSRSIPLFLVSTYIWPEDLLLKPNIKKLTSKFGTIHLLIERSHDEVASEIKRIYSHDPADFRTIIYPSHSKNRWCLTCRKTSDNVTCTICRLPTIPLSTWTSDEITQLLPELTLNHLFNFNQIPLIDAGKILVAFGFDALLAITDYRSMLYIATLLAQLREKNSTLYIVIKNPDAWTSIIHYMNNYDLKVELNRRQNQKLPPYTIALQLIHPMKAKIESFVGKIKPAIVYQGQYERDERSYRLFIMIHVKYRPLLHTVDRQGVMIDVFPNYIEDKKSS